MIENNRLDLNELRQRKSASSFTILAILVIFISLGASALQAGEPDDQVHQNLSTVFFKDGQQLRGEIVDENQTTFTLKFVSGGTIQIDKDIVAKVVEDTTSIIRADGEIWHRDPNDTRYFYAPSAFNLKKGTQYFSQKELLFSSYSYGLTDNVIVQAGGMVPLWFGGEGFNFILGSKIGASLSKYFHVGVGAQGFFLPSNGTYNAVGLVFGNATVGESNRHFTVATGVPFSSTNKSEFGKPIYVVAGNYRIGKSSAIITENWIMPNYGNRSSTMTMFGIGVRIIGEHIAADVGGVFLQDVEIPIPWLDVTYNW